MKRHPWRLLASLVLVVLSAAPASAQDAETAAERERDIQILRITPDVDSGTVSLLVALPSSIGAVEPAPANFGLIEGRERKALTVEPVSTAVDVVVVIDTSGSMKGAPLQAAQRAAADFITQLPEQARTSVVGFGPKPEALTDFDDARTRSVQAITGLRASGETALWDALALAGQVASESPNDTYIVLLSDGGDTVSQTDQNEAEKAVLGSEATLYAITLETAESDHSALRTVTTSVDGTILATEDTDTLNRLFDEVGDRLQHRYLIVFKSDRTDDRTIRVSVAIEGAIATASADIGEGNQVITLASPVPNSLSGATVGQGAEAMLGAFTAPEAIGLATGNSLWFGAIALFIGLLSTTILIVDPLGARVQSLGSIRPAEATARMSNVSDRLSGAADRAISKRDEEQGLDKALDSAGINMRPGEFAVISMALVTSSGLVASLLEGFITGVVVAALAAFLVYAFVNTKLGRRRKAFDSQLHGTINILVGAMRAGRGLPQALELVSQESSSPTAEEFRRVTVETRVGRDPVQALNAVASRMDNKDLEWISQAIQINRELGGDLTELLENLSSVIRDRGRLKLQVKALSAEGRASGWVIGALPIFMYLYMQLVNREYVSLLHTTSPGRIALLAGILAMVAGIFWIRKLVNIKY